MVVRVKVKIKPLKSSRAPISTVGIANAGFSSSRPEILVPKKLAEKIGVWPSLPEGTVVDTYGVAGGGEVRAYRIPNCAELSAGNKTAEVTVAIVEGESELILSDKTLDALEIELLRPGVGLWRFRGEKKIRKSQKPKYW
jgi:hypothetical protein